MKINLTKSSLLIKYRKYFSVMTWKGNINRDNGIMLQNQKTCAQSLENERLWIADAQAYICSREKKLIYI